MAPAITAVIAGLGLADSLVAVDAWSGKRTDVPASAVRFDMMKPDAEKLASLEPDLLLVSEITRGGSTADPFKPLSGAGISVVYLPTASSVRDIRDQVSLIAGLVGRQKEGTALTARMEGEIAAVRAISDRIPRGERRTVLFELAPAPYIYSFGRGVYLDEILALAGAENALSDESGWIAVSAERVFACDPDVILTNVDYMDDPVAEIRSRAGWQALKAVREGRVYAIDSATSSQPSPEVTRALRQIAEAVYPEYFRE